ncbi:four helix bundle protein [bacterium]|nr:four helix bundle protein [bacterium]NBX49845.1 four helix bundle protein [bacterium]
MAYAYEKLLVVNDLRELIKKIYQTTKKYPRDESFGITSQMRRSALSILLNLVEGSGRKSKKEFKRFLNIALSSTLELDACIKVSHDLAYITHMEKIGLEIDTESVYKRIAALRKSIE